MKQYLYPSKLIPAAPVFHGYRNFWLRDGWYVGLCCPEVRADLWKGMIDILDHYKWKLEIHAKKPPIHWYEFLHVRYSPDGREIPNEHWLHNQWDSIAKWLLVCLDMNRLDLAELLISYLDVVRFHRRPCAGAWEDRNTCDAYSLSACIYALQRAKSYLPSIKPRIERMVRHGSRRLYGMLLPYATSDQKVCLSLLGIVWPFNMGGPYSDEIVGMVKRELMREPYGFIRYHGDSYDGEGFSRGKGNEIPWILGDLYMSFIEPSNPIWGDRIKKVKDTYGFMPEAYFPENLLANRNSPLLWAEAMYSAYENANKIEIYGS